MLCCRPSGDALNITQAAEAPIRRRRPRAEILPASVQHVSQAVQLSVTEPGEHLSFERFGGPGKLVENLYTVVGQFEDEASSVARISPSTDQMPTLEGIHHVSRRLCRDKGPSGKRRRR